MASIELTNLTKRFDDVTAVDGIDLTVRDGEFLAVVGPSGCGKSTTLRLVSGLESPTDGSITIGDATVTDRDPHERNISMVFQNYALYPHMTARRNMTFGMRSATDFSSGEIDERVAEAAEILGITDLLERKPGALSGGERQRVALGRSIVRDPAVFLMDEPLSNLDAKLRVQMRAELAKLHDDLGTTTVYVTHDQTEAMTLGDRVAVMNDGTIQQIDTPQRLYDYPTNRFVAEFVGDPAMNVLAVSVDDAPESAAEPETVARHDAFDLPLPATSALEGISGNALLGFRPEDVSVVDGGTGAIDATVTVTEPLGDSLLLSCRVGDDEFRVRARPRSRLSPDDSVSLAVDDNRLHLFDPETGETTYHSDRARTGIDLETDASIAIEETDPEAHRRHDRDPVTNQ